MFCLLKEDNYKFIIVVIYILCNIEASFISFSFSPIIKSMKFVYNISDFDIYYFSVCYSFFFPLMNFPANYVIENVGIRLSLLIFSSSFLMSHSSAYLGFCYFVISIVIIFIVIIIII